MSLRSRRRETVDREYHRLTSAATGTEAAEFGLLFVAARVSAWIGRSTVLYYDGGYEGIFPPKFIPT